MPLPNPGPGRDSLYTPDRLERILSALRMGAFRNTAAVAGGISYSTFRSWYKQGETGVQEFIQFPDLVKAAELEGELRDLAAIDRVGEGGIEELETITTTHADGTVTTVEKRKMTPGVWTAKAWKLERKYPERFGTDREFLREMKAWLTKQKEAEKDIPAPPALPDVKPE